jgi:tetratricopeptide (TPR) repeat protein
VAATGRRWTIFCVAAVLSGTLIFQAVELGLAWYWERSNQIAVQLRGVRLEPGDADAWHRLGKTAQWNLYGPNPQGAVSYYLKAVRLDPRSALDWMDLASAYEVVGEREKAADAFEKARNDYPLSAYVAWQYGNFLLRQRNAQAGLSEIHRALTIDPSLVPLAVSNVWSFDPDADLLLNAVLPATREAHWEALDFLAARHEDDAGLKIWQRIITLSSEAPLNLKRAFPFVDDLIQKDRVADAERVWREALLASHSPQPPAADDSIIWNGGFETEIADGGLGWRFEQVPDAWISVDSAERHSGAHSLRVDFLGGTNLDFFQVHQIVPVRSSTSYAFEAFLRTQNITTESGIRFEISDPNHPQELNVFTPQLTGTNAWTPLRATLTTGPDTNFLDVRLRRLPSRLFDNKLSGTIWVDDVTLTPESNVPKQKKP